MLPYRVQEVKTGLYIYVYSGGATPSVSGDHHVTLHCARGSPSYRFYFDHISFSPFFSAFFARCVADGVRLQFGSAVQRPLRSPDDVPRRTTVVHGDSLPHVGDAFYEVVLQAAEEVERIAGGHYVPNLYECVFNMVCVYPWGEEDLLQEVAEAQCEGSRSPSGTPGAPMKSFWERCAFLPLQTVSQHRFFKKALESLRTGTCGEKRDSIAACVRQVRLAVYTQASRSPSRERILCGEHLFSLVPSISEVVAGFGTSLGTLREMLMCASQGNLLDNRLLSVLLPDVSVDCLTILTCISSQGEYASRACIDACCFGCSSERWRCLDMPSKSSRMRSGAASRDGAATSTGARNAVLPLRQAVSTSALSQHRTDEQLISEAHDARGASWTTSQPQKPIATKSHTPFPDSLLWSNSGASSQLDRSVDRLGAVRQLSKSPGGGPSLLKDGIASSPPTAEMRCTAPAPPVALGTDAVKATVETPVTPSDKGTPNESCSHGWSTVKGECGSLKAVGGLAEGAKTAPLEQNAAGQEREAQIRQSYQSGPDTAAMPPAYNNTLQTSRAGLEGREQPLHALESQRMHRAAELPHTAPAFDGAEVCVENMCKSERGVPSTNLETLDSYVAYFDAAFLLYTNTVNAKILMNDVSRFSNENINVVPLPEAAAQRWERGDQQVDAIRRQETAPIRQQRLMGLKPTALQSETRQQLGERRDAMNSTVAKIQQAPAEAGVKALEGYEESLEVVRRVPDDCNSVVRQLEDVLLRAVETANNVGPKEPHRETVRAELSIPEMAFAELHAAVDAAREAGEAEAAARVGAPAASVLEQRTIKAALDSLRTDLAAATAEYASVCTALEKSRTELHSMEGAIAGKQEELALLCAEVDAAAGDLDAIRAAKNTTREMLRCTTEELETQRVAAVHGRQGSSCGCCGSLNDTSIATAKVVAEEMRKVVEELIEAVEWIEEVEDTMVNESDRAVMTLRRCDGEMTLRIDRLMDRCACFMEVESRLAMRSALIPSEGSSRNFSRPYPNHKRPSSQKTTFPLRHQGHHCSHQGEGPKQGRHQLARITTWHHMEELAKSVQRAQAAVLGVQNDLVLLRAHVEKGAEEQDAGSIAKAAAAGLDTGVSPRNPYYVELHTTIHQRQEAASLLLQRCAHLFYEQFGVLEERAARLENVRVKEKELQSAKKSMQRYFDAHAKELEEERETHDGALQIEWARREHLEDGIVRIEVERRQQRLAHGVLFSWLKKAMMRNLAREYTRRRDAAREMYQAATCDALVQQQRVTTAQRALFTWRRRIQQRRYGRLEVTATEAEKRAQFFRNELTAIQQTFHERLGRDLGERGQMTTAVSTQEKECAQCEDEVQRLRASLHDMTIEFSERTRTYVRQQEGLEQLFAQKEEALRDTICRVQAMLTTERQAHAAFVESSGYFVSHVNAYWQARLQALDEAARRTEEFAHHTTLGLFGRLQHRYASLLQEAAKLRRDVDTLSPLSERCVRLENELAESEQLLKRRTASSQVWERRCRAAHVVGSLLTDRVAFANSAVLRSRFFVRWLERSQTTSNERLQRSIDILSDKLQAQQREMLAQQQEQSSRHQVEVAQLQDELEQLRRTNIRLQSKLETAARTQRERDSAYCDSEARNGELSAAMLREKIERRGVEDKWWSSRASGLMLQEAQQRLRVEAQEGLWWTALLIRESKTLKVWTASLHCETTQLTTVCEGWQQHCHQLDAAHETVRKSAATRTACALERGLLHAQTLAVWTSWQKWARQRRAVSAVETRSAQSRMEMIRQHGEELTRLHISHDTALQCIQREHAVEKTQLQSIHQERCATLRRVQAEEMERLSEKHAQQLTTTQAAYAADVAQRDEQADAMQEQLRHMGSLVVEYCAQATYTRWRAWAAVRQAQRAALQHRELVRQMSEWHTASAMMADASVAAKLVLCMSALTEAVQKSAVDVRRWGQHLEQEQELCHSQIHKLQAVKESVEEEATHLRGELHHVRMLYDAEAHYTDQLLRTAKAEHRARRSALTFTARMAEWQEWVFCSSADYLAAAMRVFTDAARQLISEVLATHRVEFSSHVAQVVGEEAGLTTRPHEAVALFSADVNTKDVPISDGDGVADVSGCALDLCQGGPNHVEVSTGCSGGPSSTTCPITVAQSPVKVIPKRLLLRLRSVESCLRDSGDTCGAEHEANDTASEKCRRFLSESFLEELTPTSSWPSAIACQQVEQADAPLVVCHLLEIVRLAALRGASTRNREHAAELAAIEAKRERSEEALGGLHESMEGLLAEQRTFAEEMHAHAQQQSQYPVTGESTSAQTLLMWAETWKERLGALTDRYAQVLEVFHADITRRQERSCSVNSLLMEVDAFSKVLLQRFAENVSAMAQLQQHLLAKASGEAALRDGCGSSDTNLPTNAAAAVETIRDSSPKPKPAPPLTTATLSPLHPDSAHHAASVQVSDSGVTASAQGSVLSADSLPEMRSLRDRVQLLERLLVETKVQLAEAKSLAGVACGASYIPKASAQAQLWAAQDAEDFEQLGLTKEQLLVLYGASESMTRTLMMAMREYEVKLHVTQSATAQQLRTACAAVEETLQARHRADVEHYEAKLRTLSESLAEATQEKFIAAARHGELVQQLKTEAANWAEKYTRDTELTRQSRLHEVNELADHQRLLKDELERCRRATESCVQQAVDRQTELLRSEHAEKLRRAEGDVARLTTERELLSGRLRGLEADCEQRVQQERAAVVRLQHQLAGVVGVDAVLSSVSTCASWGVTFLDTMELFASYAADKAAWFAVCATLLMDCERDQWETEVLQLREHVTQLLDVSHVSPEVPVPVRGSHQGSRNVQIDGRITSPYDKVEEDSLQALTLSPSPRRNNQGMSAGDRGGRITACDATAQHTSPRPASSLEAAQTPREAKGVQVVDGPTTTPTRCRSLSLGSLELSQSVLRFSKMLSDQRTRNATRLERASVLIADIDDLLLHGAQLTESAALKSARWNIKAVKGEGGGERE